MKVRNRFYMLLDETVDGGQGSGEAPAVVPDAPAAEPAESTAWESIVDFDMDLETQEADASTSDSPPPDSGEAAHPRSPPNLEPKVEAAPKAPVETPAPAPTTVEPARPQESSVPQTPAVPTAPVDYAALRAAEFARLEQAYALPADQATALLTEPETVLPKLAAKLHQEVMANVLAMVQAQLPQAVDSITTAKVRESEAKTEFYSAWPELRGYEQQVLAAGAMFRQINPSAPKETAIQAIGQLAMQALGLSRSAAPSVAQPAAAPRAFRPAGTTPAPRTPAPKDPFQQTLGEFMSEDF